MNQPITAATITRITTHLIHFFFFFTDFSPLLFNTVSIIQRNPLFFLSNVFRFQRRSVFYRLPLAANLRRFSSSESTTGGDDFKRPSEREALPFRTCVFKPKGSLLEGAGMELSAKLTEGVFTPPPADQTSSPRRTSKRRSPPARQGKSEGPARKSSPRRLRRRDYR